MWSKTPISSPRQTPPRTHKSKALPLSPSKSPARSIGQGFFTAQPAAFPGAASSCRSSRHPPFLIAIALTHNNSLRFYIEEGVPSPACARGSFSYAMIRLAGALPGGWAAWVGAPAPPCCPAAPFPSVLPLIRYAALSFNVGTFTKTGMRPTSKRTARRDCNRAGPPYCFVIFSDLLSHCRSVVLVIQPPHPSSSSGNTGCPRR